MQRSSMVLGFRRHVVAPISTNSRQLRKVWHVLSFSPRSVAGHVVEALGRITYLLFRVTLQIAACRATISRDLVLRTFLTFYSALKGLLRFTWLPLRHNARCVILVVENNPLLHFAVAFRTLIVRLDHSHLSRSFASIMSELPGIFQCWKCADEIRPIWSQGACS
jgi:hypothetical protein